MANKTFYALYTGPSGPISARLDATDLTAALAEIEANGRRWYDDGRTDLEDALDADWSSADEGAIRGAIEWAGGNALHYAETDSDYDVWAVEA